MYDNTFCLRYSRIRGAFQSLLSPGPRGLRLNDSGIAHILEKSLNGYVCTSSKRPPRERELFSNQMEKTALIKNIFTAFLNELLSSYYQERK